MVRDHIDDALERQFFRMYIVEKLQKADIQSALDVGDRMFSTLTKRANTMSQQTLTTEFLESLTVQRLQVNPADKEAMKTATDLWRYKHKIPTETSILDVDL